MRMRYREHRFVCGKYIEVDIYPVWEQTLKSGKRAKKSKPSSETQARLNKRNAERKLIRILNTNFTPSDIRLDLTYRPENLPASAEEANKQLKNFFRRLRYYRKKAHLPEIKYVFVTEQGARSKRFHHHVVINCGDIAVRKLAEIWGSGYTTVKPLQFNESGITGIAKYMIKDPILGRRWVASQNIQQPEESTRDGYISQRKVREIAQCDYSFYDLIDMINGELGGPGYDIARKEVLNRIAENPHELEKIYRKCILTECKSYFNEVNGSYYITVLMCEDTSPQRRRRR